MFASKVNYQRNRIDQVLHRQSYIRSFSKSPAHEKTNESIAYRSNPKTSLIKVIQDNEQEYEKAILEVIGNIRPKKRFQTINFKSKDLNLKKLEQKEREIESQLNKGHYKKRKYAH